MKERLKKIREEGTTRKLMGVKIDHTDIDMYCEKTLFDDNNNIVGKNIENYNIYTL